MKVPTRPAPPPPTGANSKNLSFFGQRGKSENKKKPPPRPPPPKFTQTRDQRGSQLVSALFPRYQSKAEPATSFIDWSSPPSSPTFTTRSSSDALSVNSFGSDSVTPSSGSGSNVESGFEDDFDVYGTTRSKCVDPWSPPQPVAKAPVKSSTWVTFSPNAVKRQMMPTIIRAKPERPKVSKVLEKKMEMVALAEVFENARITNAMSATQEEEDDGWSSDSPPMPTCPPPAPPPELLAGLLEETLYSESTRSDSTGGKTAIALYDYDGAPGDLSFRKGDRVKIISHIDEHWVQAALANRQGSAPLNHLQVEESDPYKVTALYAFAGETWEDLSFQIGEQIRVVGRVNADWLYGECNGRRGQFPQAFIDRVPSNLPIWTA